MNKFICVIFKQYLNLKDEEDDDDYVEEGEEEEEEEEGKLH